MAKKAKELQFSAPNKVGVLSNLTSAFKKAGVNILSIWAYGEGSKAYFGIITSRNEAAKKILKKLGMPAKEKEMLVMNCQNKVGVLARVAATLAKAKINITCLSGSTCGKRGTVVLSTNQNNKAARLV